jgi:hypothetical protein
MRKRAARPRRGVKGEDEKGRGSYNVELTRKKK